MANTQLKQTPTNTNSRQKFTVSFWLKRSKISSEQCVWTTRSSGSANVLLRFNANDTFTFKDGAGDLNLITSRVFRDTSAWMNIVLAVDTTQGTAANRAKIYLNGVQETSFGTETYPSQNTSLEINEAGNQIWYIGSENSQNYFNGLISYFAFVSGTQEVPGIFGETDSTTGEWKIKTTITPSVGWGNNGFLILKNGNSVTDQSGSSNDFSYDGGTLTNTKDSPDNVFCVLNFLDTTRGLSNGNTTYLGASSGTVVKGTLGMSSGKYYAECKILSAAENMIGVLSMAQAPSTVYVGQTAVGWGMFGNGYIYNNGSSTGSPGNSFADNDIMGIALDMDNNKLYFSKNGVFLYSGDPTSGATGTGATSITSGLTMTFCGGRDSSSDTANFNFGNGTFGANAVASEGTNASNNGIFEYDVPTGYTALSTKGLNL